MENMLRVGVVSSTHGVRGEVKVFPTTDDAKRFKKLKTVILDTGKGQTTLEIEQVKFFKNMVILKFKGYDNINDVETWRQKDLLITREQAVTLKPDEYFITDLIGLLVKDDEGNDLPKTVIIREYSSEWKPGDEPYYPVNDEKNGALYSKYRELAQKEKKVVFGGRLGEYKYYDMDAVIASALDMCEKELG